jgi:hypothetical protein
MLSDTQIERWSRQILLPDVGGRGQLRLLGARVGVLGDHPATAAAIDLLRRAGVPVAPGSVPQDAEVVLDLRDLNDRDAALPEAAARAPVVRGRVAGATGCVVTLVGRPCARCAPSWAPHATETDHLLADAAGRVLASLVAAEVIRVLLAPPGAGRRHTFDLNAGAFASDVLDGAGCAACGRRA